MTNLKRGTRLAFLSLAISLAACGGGGGGGGVSVGPVVPDVDSFFAAVLALIRTAPDNTEPADISAIVATSPDTKEPVAGPF